MQWFIKDGADDPVEMLSFSQAESMARRRSRINSTGMVETLVLNEFGRLFVDAIFLRGRKLLRGQRARESSRLQLPPRI